MPKTPCPTPDQLFDFLQSRTGEVPALEFETHVADCPSCQTKLYGSELTDESLVAALKRGVEPGEFEGEPELQLALEQIERMPACDKTSVMNAGESARHVSQADSNDTVLASEMGLLGPYRVLEFLAKGGMGAVYKAEHARLEMIVAIKVLCDRLSRDPEAVARFGREMKAVGKINQRNVVRAYDAGEHDGRLYLAMEFIDGRNLDQIVKSRGQLPIAAACEVVRQALVGMHCAHGHGLVHRDLKPSNLMVNRDGEVKVLDLGLARLLTPTANDVLTSEFQVMGTADFMAPEQAMNARGAGLSTDIYSLGCTLYALLCGRPPFSGAKYDSSFAKLMAHHQEPPAPVITLRPEVPVGLSAVVDKALSKSQHDRYSTAAEFADALQPYVAGADLVSLATGAGEFPKSESGSVDRHSDGVGADGSATATPSAVTGPNPDAMTSRRPLGTWAWLAVPLGLIVVGGLLSVIAAQNRAASRPVAVEEGLTDQPPDTASVEPSSVRVFRPDAQHERRAAEWAVTQGAIVTIGCLDREYQVVQSEELPAEDFQIWGIQFTKPIAENDPEFTLLCELVRLDRLHFIDPELTDALVDQLIQIPRLRFLTLRYETVLAKNLDRLARCKHFQELKIEGSVSDEEVAGVFQLTNTDMLALESPKITDKSLIELRKMDSLTGLSLLFTRISDEGLEHLRPLSHLELLFLPYTPVTDKGLNIIKDFKGLYWLNLGDTTISDRGLAQLSQHPRLKILTLSHTKITNAGLGHLRPIASLRSLDLRESRIDDAGVDALADLTQLTELRLGDRLSADAVRELRTRMPGCRIASDTAPEN